MTCGWNKCSTKYIKVWCHDVCSKWLQYDMSAASARIPATDTTVNNVMLVQCNNNIFMNTYICMSICSICHTISYIITQYIARIAYASHYKNIHTHIHVISNVQHHMHTIVCTYLWVCDSGSQLYLAMDKDGVDELLCYIHCSYN